MLISEKLKMIILLLYVFFNKHYFINVLVNIIENVITINNRNRDEVIIIEIVIEVYFYKVIVIVIVII